VLYTFNTGAIEYMVQNKLPIAFLSTLENIRIQIKNESDWCIWMDGTSGYQQNPLLSVKFNKWQILNGLSSYVTVYQLFT